MCRLFSLCVSVHLSVSVPLSWMQQGVNDNLTAEDLHLLMNGSPVVDMEVLKKRTSFMDESCKGHMT